ncbi:MAG: glycosyltransferase family 39 protein [Candidatus Falkowbacteria bacterium]
MSILTKLTKNWRITTLIMLSVLFFFIYSWLPYQTSKDGEERFASPDGTANYFWTERYATLSPLSLRSVAKQSRVDNNLSHQDKTDVAKLTGLPRRSNIASLIETSRNDSSDSGLIYFEPLNLIANDIVIPRSVRSENGIVKPVSFLGIILIYGWLAKIFGIWIIKYLTSLFAVLGVLCFYGIIKRVFNSNTAFISAVIMLALAPYWYYTARSMFHNVLLVDLVLISIWFLINSTRIERIKRINANFIFIFLSGVFIGLAIITRVSELIWLAPVILLIWIFYFKQIQLDKLILFFCGIILALIPMFYYNQILYGDYLKFGYTQETMGVENEIVVEDVNNNTHGIATGFALAMTEKILPFGFYPKNIVRNFYYYFVYIFWYLFWSALLGGILFLYKYKDRNKQEWLYFISFCITSVILVIFYGSWNIQDNIRLNSITIGNSYMRYWLPMYIMSIPLAVMFWQWIASILSSLFFFFCHSRPRFHEDKLQRESRNNKEWIPGLRFATPGMTKYGIITLFVITFFILNIQTTVYGQDEGLIYVKQGIEENKERAKHVDLIIENDAIIITKHLDKFFFPDRGVIAGDLLDDNKNQQYKKLIDHNVPLYYYGFIFQQKDLDFLHNEKLIELGLQIEIVELNKEAKLGLYKLISY